jgi:hypothetical protein
MEGIREDVLDAWLKIGNYLAGQTPERRSGLDEGPQARSGGFGAGETIRRGDYFSNDEKTGRKKEDGNTF